MANWNLVFGAVLVVVVSTFVSVYLPKVKEAQMLKDRQSVASSTASFPVETAAADAATTTREDSSLIRDTAVEALKRFAEAMTKGGKVSLANVLLEPDLAREHSNAAVKVVAAQDIAAQSTIVDIPASLIFNGAVLNPALRRGLDTLVAKRISQSTDKGEDVSPLTKFWNDTESRRTFEGVFHLAFQMQNVSRSAWGPWLLTLPSASAVMETSPTMMQEDDVACLNHFELQILQEMVRRRAAMWNLTKLLCDADGSDTEGEKEKRTPQNLVRMFTCSLSEGQIMWAAAVFQAKEMPVGGYPSIVPLLDMIPYAIDANVRPGQIQTDDEGHFVSLSLVAAKDIKKGDLLTFRTGIRHPSEVFLSTGFHHRRHYEPLGGAMLPLEWSAAVRDITAQTIQCGARESTTWIPFDGSADADLLRCADLEHALRMLESSSGSPASAADLEVYLLQSGIVTSTASIPELEPTPAGKQLIKDALRKDYSLVESEQCALTAECKERKLCQSIITHATFVQSVVESFVASSEE